MKCRHNLFLIAMFTVTLTACAPTSWQDITGNDRRAPDLQMDSANCQLDSQSAPQTDTSQCQNKACTIGGTLGNVLSQANNFNLCMQSRGWQQVQVASVAAPQQVQVTENDDDVDDTDSDDIMADAKAALANQDYSTALELYREAADDGNAEAENTVGLFYVNGWGLPQDHKKAMHWFRKADRDGSVHAKNSITSLHQQRQLQKHSVQMSGLASHRQTALVLANRQGSQQKTATQKKCNRPGCEQSK